LEYVNIEWNNITDVGIELLYSYLIGNTSPIGLNISGNEKITDNSASNLIDLATKTSLIDINVEYTSLSDEICQEILDHVKIPIIQREIPLILVESVKSASKIT